MSSQRFKGRAKNLTALPQPPSSGWRLKEALAALCPEEATLYRQGGPKLASLVEEELRGTSDVPNFRDGWGKNLVEDWLSRRLILGIGKRTDLSVSGRAPLRPAWEARIVVPRDVLEAACRRWRGITDEDGWYMAFDFRSEMVWIRRFHYDGSWTMLPSDLVDVRVEPSQMVPVSPSESEIEAFIRDMRSSLPKGARAPNEVECRNAAIAHFGCHIPRDLFRRIRKEAAPEWAKPGPRGPRNFTRDGGQKTK